MASNPTPTHNYEEVVIGVASVTEYAGTDSQTAYGSVAAPAAGTVFASLAIATTGEYEVVVYPRYSGTVAAAELDNVVIYSGPTQIGRIPMDAAVGGPGSPYRLPRVVAASGTAINVAALGAATAGSVYRAGIVATRRT